MIIKFNNLYTHFILTTLNRFPFINENKLCTGRFAWQDSAAAFSISKSDVDRICKYILYQCDHHHKISFAEEYEKFIKYYQKTLKLEK